MRNAKFLITPVCCVESNSTAKFDLAITSWTKTQMIYEKLEDTHRDP